MHKSLLVAGVLFYALSVTVVALAGEVYRYQDENGRWRFTDKKPNAQHETVSFKAAEQEEVPSLGYRQEQGQNVVVARNPWWGPVLFTVLDGEQIVAEDVVAAQSDDVIEAKSKPLLWHPKLHYRYHLGDPSAQFDDKPLSAPVAPVGKYLVTQGFNGAFSHNNPANAYAVDIGMNVGDDITAAREGTVVWVKDDYHMSGVNDYFFDKANGIRILHSDGSFGLYAHIHLGSAKVKLGDTVTAGQVIARCGSTGFSTGPHLHFAVQVNSRQGWVTVPFTFLQQGVPVQPNKDQWLRSN